MVAELIYKEDVLKFLDGRIKECVDMNSMDNSYLNAEIATLQGVREVVKGLIGVGADWKLWVENRDGKPYAYRYGPEWVGMQLFMEGGYKTPEEAKLRWLEYWEGQK